MPYTNPWSVTAPLDTSAANQIGADIRALRQDLQDRFNGVLVEDMTADPLVLQPTVSGAATGLQKIIPFSAFLNNLNVKSNDLDAANGLINVYVGQHYAAPLLLPAGCIITQMEYMLNIGGCAQIVGTLYYRSFNAILAIGTSGQTICNTVGNATITVSPAMNITLDDTHYFWIRIDPQGVVGNSGTLYGVRVTYNRPSNQYAT